MVVYRDLKIISLDPDAPVPQEPATPSPPPADDSDEDRPSSPQPGGSWDVEDDFLMDVADDYFMDPSDDDIDEVLSETGNEYRFRRISYMCF